MTENRSQLSDVAERLNKQAEVLLDLAESSMPPEPKQLQEFMLLSSEACDLLRSLASDQPEPQADSIPEIPPSELQEKWRLILDLVNRPEYRTFREVSTFEAFRKLYPEMLEREILVGDVTECVCAAMDRANLTCKQLADKVGWSRKKLKRVLSGDITVKQVARLLFACDCRAEVTVGGVTVGGCKP